MHLELTTLYCMNLSCIKCCFLYSCQWISSCTSDKQASRSWSGWIDKSWVTCDWNNRAKNSGTI